MSPDAVAQVPEVSDQVLLQCVVMGTEGHGTLFLSIPSGRVGMGLLVSASSTVLSNAEVQTQAVQKTLSRVQGMQHETMDKSSSRWQASLQYAFCADPRDAAFRLI
jgi:hypothetical protein